MKYLLPLLLLSPVLNAQVIKTAPAGANSLNFFTNTSTKVFVGGGIGYIPYTVVGTTTTPADNTTEVIFSTLTVPANLFTRAGQSIIITCRFWGANTSNTKNALVRFNSNSVLSSVGVGSGASATNALIENKAVLSWVSHDLWIDSAFGYNANTVLNTPPAAANTPRGTQTFDETTALTFNCTCKNSTAAAGDCSFLDMRMELGGM